MPLELKFLSVVHALAYLTLPFSHVEARIDTKSVLLPAGMLIADAF